MQIFSDLILLGGVLPAHLNSLMPEVQQGKCGGGIQIKLVVRTIFHILN
jgi:hypothetical protein